jgi:hypothetical protein
VSSRELYVTIRVLFVFILLTRLPLEPAEGDLTYGTQRTRCRKRPFPRACNYRRGEEEHLVRVRSFWDCCRIREERQRRVRSTLKPFGPIALSPTTSSLLPFSFSHVRRDSTFSVTQLRRVIEFLDLPLPIETSSRDQRHLKFRRTRKLFRLRG